MSFANPEQKIASIRRGVHRNDLLKGSDRESSNDDFVSQVWVPYENESRECEALVLMSKDSEEDKGHCWSVYVFRGQFSVRNETQT